MLFRSAQNVVIIVQAHFGLEISILLRGLLVPTTVATLPGAVRPLLGVAFGLSSSSVNLSIQHPFRGALPIESRLKMNNYYKINPP